MTEEKLVAEIKSVVEHLNWLSRMAADMNIQFELDSLERGNPHVGVTYKMHTVTINKRLK